MGRAEFVQVFTPLLVALRQEFDKPQWTAYFRALEDVPAVLLDRAIVAYLRDDAKYFPRPGELRARAEKVRQEIVAAHPYDGCEECTDQRGWRNVTVNGVPRVEKCPCRARYLARLEALGASVPLLTAGSPEVRDESLVSLS